MRIHVSIDVNVYVFEDLIWYRSSCNFKVIRQLCNYLRTPETFYWILLSDKFPIS